LSDAIDDGENGGHNPSRRDNHPWAQASHVATVSPTNATRNTVHVNRHTARVFLIEAGHKKAHKAQKMIGGEISA
jgi:hypothetical protein